MIRQVAAVIPTLDEAAHIGGLLEKLARSPSVIEILVADGGSADGTRAIVEQAALADPRIRLIDNPKRLQSAGINRAVRAAEPRANTIVRIDAHAGYPDDYVERILEAFETSGAQMVATRLRTTGHSCLQRGIAAAANSRLGAGGSAHRIGGEPRFVDHGHHAGIDRAAFERAGGYDENFATNEDAELDYRIRLVGGRIWLASDIEVDYEPRATWRALLRQYWRYGRGRAATYVKHGEQLKLRQALPPLLTLLLGASLLLAAFQPLLLLIPLLYAAALAAGAIGLAYRSASRCALFAAPAAAAMHLAWGAGFVATLLTARRDKGADLKRARLDAREGTAL